MSEEQKRVTIVNNGEQQLPQSGLAQAARRAAQGEDASASGVLETIGGARGIIESSLPGVVFLVLFTITKAPIIAALCAAAAALVILCVRFIRKEPLAPGYSAIFGVALCAVFVMWRGNGSDYYIPGFIINAVYAAVFLVSVLIGRPLIGLIAGFLSGNLLRWRESAGLRRLARWLTLAWAGMMLLRLAVQLPLFYAGNVEGLGVARLVMGLPLYALLLFLTWRLCAAAIAADKAKSAAPTIVV